MLLFDVIMFMIIMILHQQSIKLLKTINFKKPEMKPTQSKIIVLKSVKDFSKSNSKINCSLELQQIKSMFNINKQMPYMQKSSSMKTDKLQLNTTMKKLQLQRYAQLMNTVDYSDLQIGLLGTKSKSLNLKAKKQRSQTKKQKKKKKINEDKSKNNIKNKYLRLQPISINRKQNNVSQLIQKMQGMLKRQQQLSIRNVRRVVTQGTNININIIQKDRKPRQQFSFVSSVHRYDNDKQINRFKIGIRRELLNRSAVEQKKKMDRLLSDMNKNILIQVPSVQKRGIDHLGPWNYNQQQNEQI